ncbi:hypothetical protein AJ79_06632 [Helicocarpus griseus UAMH5409]|uniref:DUF2293 domain-containing protein n=1 Tax=Helicocarpus griseus UAMH5409 TaxID=1447875 RepID=A0A2B7XBT0_9EURO|nr:hypothetical protein AJ79_06632 [Helicocarpus griseus UAMH5409]
MDTPSNSAVTSTEATSNKKRTSSRIRRRKTRNSTSKTAPKSAVRKKRPKSNSGPRVPRELRRALEKQKEVGEKLGDASLEEIRTDAQGPPPDYVFVPKGDVYITRNCRTRCHEARQTVYTVYNPKSRRTLGLYVPTDIHTAVTLSAADTQSARAQAVAQKDLRDSTKARELLETHFPNMPAQSLEKVLGHAFLKGSRRVGRSGKIESDEVKVRLAVEAHIRHEHTDYDRLLDCGVEWKEARARVRAKVNQVLALWQESDKIVEEARMQLAYADATARMELIEVANNGRKTRAKR